MMARLALGLLFMSVVGGLAYMTQQYMRVKAEKEMAIQAFDTYAKNAQNEAIERNKALEALNRDYQAARDRKVISMQVFDDHDLNQLLAKKPGLVRRRFVDGFDRLFSAIETASRPVAGGGETPAAGRDPSASAEVAGG